MIHARKTIFLPVRVRTIIGAKSFVNPAFFHSRAMDVALQKIPARAGSISDAQLLVLFDQEPQKAWELFAHKYSGLVFSTLQRMGFDYDESMDRFVYVFEKLREENFRRLKSIRYEGSYGDLTPWLRTVVQRLSISWLRSIEGRKRLLKPIAKLSKQDQRVFELYFWKGYCPSMISEQIKLEQRNADLTDVFDSLERIFSVLTQNNRWRLMSKIMKISRNVQIDKTDEETGIAWHPQAPDSTPEEAMLIKETMERMNVALKNLSREDQLLIQLRYVEGASLKQLSAVFHKTEREIHSMAKDILCCLRKKLCS